MSACRENRQRSEVCPRCGGIDTVHVTQDNAYGIRTTCDRCNNEVYRSKALPGRTAMRVIDVLRARWDQRRAHGDYVAVEAVACHLFSDYARAVDEGASGTVLAGILTGLAGCEFAMSRLNPAMGWGMDTDEDGCTVGESCRRGGLLLQEIAYAAGDDDYRGVRALELQREDIAGALQNVALAYRGWVPNPRGNHGVWDGPASVGQRLDELWNLVFEVFGGQATEVLVPLVTAHGYDLDQCACDLHHGYTVERS